MRTIFCWQARRRFADRIDGVSIAQAADARLDLHLESCERCALDFGRLRLVKQTLSATAPAPIGLPLGFEQRVVRAARERKAALSRAAGTSDPIAAVGGRAPWRGLPARGPLPIGAALGVLLVAVTMARFFHGAPAETPDLSPDARASVATQRPATSGGPTTAGDLNDGVVASPEVPFVVREDLIGERRGRIPLTTYVLEPAPDRSTPSGGRTLMRASL